MALVVAEMHSAPVAAVRFYVRAGSVYEQEFTGAGISHFLEHLLGSGTATRTAQQIDDLQESMGNQANAYTSSAHSCYHMVTSARYVDEAIELMADYVLHAQLDAKDVETQRGIILREMAMGADDPGRRLYQLLSQTMFTVHPERYRTIGYPERFKEITREDLLTYYRRMVTPDNIVVVVVGDFESGHVLATLEKCLGAEPRMATVFPPLPVEPPQVSERQAEETDPHLSRAYLAIGYRTVDLFHPDMYPIDVLAGILAGGGGSRLVSRLRDTEGLVDDIDCSSLTPVYDAGRLVVTAVLAEDKLAVVEQAIAAELARLTRERVTPRELERAKAQTAAALVYQQGDVESWAATLGTDYLSTGDVDFSRRYAAKIAAVSAEGVRAVARRYLTPTNRTVVVRRAGTGKPAAAATTTAAAQARPTTKLTLPNGITLLVQEDHRAPMVTLQASFTGGLRYETPETAGSGGFLAEMLMRGTRTRTRLEIAQALEDVGASLGVTSGRNSLGMSGVALSRDLDRLVSLAADCLRNPRFAPEEVERERGLRLAAIEAQQDSPDAVTSRLMLETLFRTHPYRLDPAGTVASVKQVTPATLAALHARLCQPQRMVLALSGDLAPDQAQAVVLKRFGDWQPGTAGDLKLAPEPPPATVQRVTKVREQQQGIVYLGFPGPRVDSPDRFALDVLDAALSGIGYPGGRLHEKLRGEKLVYATHMVPVPGLDPGYVLLYAATEPAKLEVVERIIRELIVGMQTTPLPADELERGKRMCICAHEIALGEVASRIMTETLDELYGLGYQASATYAAQIEPVTAAQVQAAARKYLDLEHCVIATTRPPDKGGDNG